MQSWGTSSRQALRGTDRQPSKSGIVGLLAAAQGRRRSESIEDLAGLKIAVRTDQPGRVIRDFHTARTRDGKTSMPLSQRDYLEDAVFVVAIEGPAEIIEGLGKSIKLPKFQLFLGRKSCPPSAPLFIKITDDSLLPAIRNVDWQATEQYRTANKGRTKRLEIIYDGAESPSGYVQDVPVSFDPQHRLYRMRAIQRDEITMPRSSPSVSANPETAHDPFGGLD